MRKAQNAISKFNGAEWEGRAMTVNEARPMAPREGGRRRRSWFRRRWRRRRRRRTLVVSTPLSSQSARKARAISLGFFISQNGITRKGALPVLLPLRTKSVTHRNPNEDFPPMFQRSIISQCLVFSLLLQAAPAFAAGSGRPSVLDSLQQTGPAQTAEYIFRNSPRDNLITVQLFGSVVRPGIYYVPEDTDLMRILTLAGGVVNTGELDEVIVRKSDGKAWSKVDDRYVEQTGPGTYSVNVDKLVRYTRKLAPLKLSHDDFVYIPPQRALSSRTTPRRSSPSQAWFSPPCSRWC